MSEFTHFDSEGKAIMVDIGEKPISKRVASAEAKIFMEPDTLTMIQRGEHKKGDVLGVARLAGIMAAKHTSDMIPLCHPIDLTSVKVEADFEENNCVAIKATCIVLGRTGVEMEALLAASIAALTVYDMCKSVDRGMTVGSVRLTHKSGGKSGTFEATE